MYLLKDHYMKYTESVFGLLFLWKDKYIWKQPQNPKVALRLSPYNLTHQLNGKEESSLLGYHLTAYDVSSISVSHDSSCNKSTGSPRSQLNLCYPTTIANTCLWLCQHAGRTPERKEVTLVKIHMGCSLKLTSNLSCVIFLCWANKIPKDRLTPKFI